MKGRFRFLVILAAASFATGIPIGLAIADDEPAAVEPVVSTGVPADQCPEAKALFERYGEPVDTFHPDCPPPERLEDMKRSLELSEEVEEAAEEADEEADPSGDGDSGEE
ncbi:MAG TPA: hypothetical protein VIL04_06765 [Solirubrobacterales bacterium]|jgi:hypothetical protein